MIQFSHIYKTYPGPVHALRDINLEVNKGEFIFLLGPSGAGKTTLFRLISGFDRASSGRLNVAGHDLKNLNENDLPLFRRKIGVVFQDFRLLKDRSVFENVALPLEVLSEKGMFVTKKTNEVLDLVGLKFKKDQLPEQLSGGEQQRVAIARAVIHQPDLLIADEPTGNLDSDLSEEIMELFDRVNAQGTTVVVATHNLEMVKKRRRREIRLLSGCLEGGQV